MRERRTQPVGEPITRPGCASSGRRRRLRRMEAPETRYTKTGGGTCTSPIRCSARAASPRVPRGVLELDRGHVGAARLPPFLERLGSFARVICIDQRGTGSSDRLPVRAAHARGLGGRRDHDDGGGRLEKARPRRRRGRRGRDPVRRDVPGAGERPRAGQHHGPLHGWRRTIRGGLAGVRGPAREGARVRLGPGACSRPSAERRRRPRVPRWWARYQRLGSSPGTVLAMRHMLQQLDVRHVLPSIRVPTLVISRRTTAWSRRCTAGTSASTSRARASSRWRATTTSPSSGTPTILDEVEEFLTGSRRPAGRPMLATILVTDIVDSTAGVGDGRRAWREVLERHHALVRRARAVPRHRDRHRRRRVPRHVRRPARAIRCASPFGTGCARSGSSPGRAPPARSSSRGRRPRDRRPHGGSGRRRGRAGEVLVSSTVRDLVAGAGIAFEDRGAHELKGVPEAASVRGDGRVKVAAARRRHRGGEVPSRSGPRRPAGGRDGDRQHRRRRHDARPARLARPRLGHVLARRRLRPRTRVGAARRDVRATEELRAFDPDMAWFNLGDLDLATHLFRSNLLAGAPRCRRRPPRVAARFGVAARLLPMSDDRSRRASPSRPTATSSTSTSRSTGSAAGRATR